MSHESRCAVVRARLLEGDHDHEHMAGCLECRAYFDRLAMIDGLLASPPQAPRAPAGFTMAVTRQALEDNARRRQWATAVVAVAVLIASGLAAWASFAWTDASIAGAAVTAWGSGLGTTWAVAWSPAQVAAVLGAVAYAVAIGWVVRLTALEF